jgi:murein DD-endopeptidase MepM/ murein hydrolase activator NlpD
LRRKGEYFLDLNDLLYKPAKLPWKGKLLRVLVWFAATVVIAIIYSAIFNTYFGSPKVKLLNQEIDNLQLKYALAAIQLDSHFSILQGLRMSDEVRYRPILELDSIPQIVRNPGYGGIDRYRDIEGYQHTDLMRSSRSRMDRMTKMANVQAESFNMISKKSVEWKRQVDHFPGISPVNVKFRLGDRYRLRVIHPVLGTPRMHNGQDFEVPYGTEVYATGDGRIIEAGWDSGGFGNCIVIDHDYGFQTVYGHLSEIKVVKGQGVKRGDLIGISGNTGLSSGPHLHYQVEKLGKSTDPINFFNNDVSLEEYNEMIQAFGTRKK